MANARAKPTPPSPAPAGERIAKVLARAGMASRREAERMIASGRVAVNGKTLRTPAVTVTGSETITVDGVLIPEAEAPRLFRFHKPTGLLVTRSDPEGRSTVFDVLPAPHRQLIAVGRLDLNSEGLLLFTNDGGLARTLELPATGWRRKYRVRAFGRPKAADLAKLARGITVDGERFGAIEAELERQQGGNAWITVTLQEGKNREVRRALEAIGLKVNRLIRTGYGPFHLGNLPAKALDEIKPRALKASLGKLIS